MTAATITTAPAIPAPGTVARSLPFELKRSAEGEGGSKVWPTRPAGPRLSPLGFSTVSDPRFCVGGGRSGR
jgi:hypothetical protein